jgi:hypothetical protein
MKSKRSSFLLATISMVLLLITLEIIGRTVLCFVMKYPFWQPSRKFYPELEKIRQLPISQNYES